MPAIAAHEYAPQDFWREASPDERADQLALQRTLVADHRDRALGDECFVSQLASVAADVLLLGDRSYVSAGAHLAGEVVTGRESGIGPYAVLRGRVTVGDGVTVGAHASLLGFDRSAEPDAADQMLHARGIEIGDEVRIGARAVVHDGVTIGSQAVVAPRSVVVESVPAGAVVSGNPAAFLRWRTDPDDNGTAPNAAATAAARGAHDEPEPGAPPARDEEVAPSAGERVAVANATLRDALAHATARNAARAATDRQEAEPAAEPAAVAEPTPMVEPAAEPAPAAVARPTPEAMVERGPAGEPAPMVEPAAVAESTTETEPAPAATIIESASELGPTPPAPGLAARVAELAAGARDEASTLLDRAWNPDAALFTDRPGVDPTLRAQCDAVEIADLLLGTPPTQARVDTQLEVLRDWPDAATGGDAANRIVNVGGALDLLGSGFGSPLTWATDATAERVVALCDGLPWTTDAAGAGRTIDAFATALARTRRAQHPLSPAVEDTLFGWLLLHADPHTGMWGQPSPEHGLLPLVSGFSRICRGTFAQVGIPLPHPEPAIDTLLRHARDPRWLAPHGADARHVLAAAYPLWLTRGSGYRTDEVHALATRLLSEAMPTWVPEAGYALRATSPATDGLPETEPSLRGTEMWLTVIWYLSDLVGVSGALGYRPRGAHRPDPMVSQRR